VDEQVSSFAINESRLETRLAQSSFFQGAFALGARSKISIGVLSVLGTLLALPTLLWAAFWIVSFIDRLGQEKCKFGSIDDVEYESILYRASAQRWTVWPGLSNGVFLPSSGENIAGQIVLHVGELAGSDPSSSRQLASAHAVMRSIGAEYVQTFEVPDVGQNSASSRVYFTYYLPKVRFAPACFFCLVWWYTTIDVIFSHELATDRYEFQPVNVLQSGLKGNLIKKGARNVPVGACPALPSSLQPRG
jgi:hypothetical protein